VELQKDPQLNWLEAFKKEIQYYLNLWNFKPVLKSCFVGGGTPSLLHASIWEELSVFLKENFIFNQDTEWTLEANPEDFSIEKLKLWKNVGINRISVGIQSFQEKYLARLERQSSVEKNRQALNMLSQNWNGNWSMDLMYGLPGQNLKEWEGELKEAVNYLPPHLSTYQLTLSTPRSLNWKQDSEDELHGFYKIKKEFLSKYGYNHYEISNFCRDQKECAHNLSYWELDSFLGTGPGAYGLLSASYHCSSPTRFGVHQKNPSRFEEWAKHWDVGSVSSLSLYESRTALDHLKELLMVSLRLQKGVRAQRLPSQLLTFLKESLAYQGYFEIVNEHLKLKESGRIILDHLLKSIFKDIESLAPRLDFNEIDPMFGK
jgi:oxygen-independent coproporphyrinogen-3 oxidase